MSDGAAPEPSGTGWDPDSSRRWLAHLDVRERQLEPVSDALFEQAALRPGERVLDVGCGAGPTTVRARATVRPGGTALGVDVSPEMIGAARKRSGPGLDWLVADAQTHAFPPQGFDVVISRFGVMFFDDPDQAFANLAASTRSGGRMAIAVWRLRAEAPFFAHPYALVREVLDRAGVGYLEPPGEDGPFALGHLDRTRAMLTGAGWSSVEVVSDDRPLYLGGPGDTAHATETALELGPVRRLLDGVPAAVVADVRTELLRMAEERHDGIGVPLPGGFMIVTAVRV